MKADRERSVWLTKSSLRETAQPAKWHNDPHCKVLGLATSGVIHTNAARAKQLADREASCCVWARDVDLQQAREDCESHPAGQRSYRGP